MDELVERVAEVIHGKFFKAEVSDPDAVARAVIESLGLREERIRTALCDDETRTVSDFRTERRYVTDWTRVDE